MGEPTLSTSIAPFGIERREATTTEVARKLLDHLLAGQFDPGYRLPSERKLAADLGVGRSVVREALKSLALLGIVASSILALVGLTFMVFPEWDVIGLTYMFPMFLYEVGLGLWLLVKGLREPAAA